MNAAKAEASLAELFGELTRETGVLVRQEVQLAGAEMGQKATRAASDFSRVALGALVAQAGLVVVLVALAMFVSAWLPMWAATLAVGSAALILGVIVAAGGRAALRRLELAPKETLGTLRQDKAWLKEQLR